MQSDGQKSLRDYFMSEKLMTICSPSGRDSLSSPSGSKRTLSDEETERLSSTPAKKKPSPSKHIVVIDSDVDEDAENIFQHSTKYRKSNFYHSPTEKNIFQGQSRQLVASANCKKKMTRSRPGKWSCSTCTYSNHPLISYCEICSTGRDSQPTCSSMESASHVVSSGSEVDGLATDSCKQVLEPLSCQQHSSPSRSSQENSTPRRSYSLESDDDDMLTVSQVKELSNCTSANPAVCDTSLLNTLSIDNEQPNGANGVSNSDANKNLEADAKGEDSSASDVDFSNTTVHRLFQFSCSRNSSRIYVYDKVSATF